MRIFYPYNEILPKKAAHDVYIVNQCHHLAKAGLDVTLLVGQGSAPLHKHYELSEETPLTVTRLPIIRKNNPINLSWNRPFFHCVQKQIESIHPDVVFLSVRKQGAYHLNRKKRGTFYIYEVHELCHYPKAPGEMRKEKAMLEKADLITVTTEALATILKSPPYNLKNPIVNVPLAVNAKPLPPPPPPEPFTLAYVGQLYKGQGVELLLKALQQIPLMHLHIFGGKQEEIASLKSLAAPLKDRITFFGHLPPHKLPAHLKQIHAFVAPFEPIGRMPYVAHTKLLEYSNWGRPFVVPNLPCIKKEHQNALFFEPGSISSLTEALQAIPDLTFQKNTTVFSWKRRISLINKLLFS